LRLLKLKVELMSLKTSKVDSSYLFFKIGQRKPPKEYISFLMPLATASNIIRVEMTTLPDRLMASSSKTS